MRTAAYSAVHLSDAGLRQEASTFAAGERSNLVQFLVRIAEIDSRKLHLGACYSSMSAFCMGEYRLTEDEAFKRLTAARIAREYPVLFEELDAGHLCLSRIRMMAPHLTRENLAQLVEAAKRYQRLTDFRRFLDGFTKPDLLLNTPISVAQSPSEIPPETTTTMRPSDEVDHSVEVDHSLARGRVSSPPDTQETAPPDLPNWVNLRIKAPKDKWEHLRNLLSHSVSSGDASKIFLHMLDATIEKLEKQKFGVCKKPRGPRPSALRRQRSIPAHVRRAVLERDGGQCTAVSRDTGRRCDSKRRIEFDHIVPVARGGKATVEGLRLLCHDHNQYEAEQAFGAEFMQIKREKARQARQIARAKKRAGEKSPAAAVADAPSPGEARQVAERSGALQQTTLEARPSPRKGVRSG